MSMTFDAELKDFYTDDPQRLVDDPLRFKAKLHIGDDAFQVLSSFDTFNTMIGAGSAGAAIASSSYIASAFFGQGLLYSVGLVAAATPIGWVVGAGVGAAGLAFGIKKAWSDDKSGRVLTVPKYINTPIDLLALRLTELMIPIALKIAYADRSIEQSEINKILNYFSNEWGLNQQLVKQMIDDNIESVGKLRYKDLASSIVAFTAENKDCNQLEMCKDLLGFVEEITGADGVVCEREEIELDFLRHALLPMSHA